MAGCSQPSSASTWPSPPSTRIPCFSTATIASPTIRTIRSSTRRSCGGMRPPFRSPRRGGARRISIRSQGRRRVHRESRRDQRVRQPGLLADGGNALAAYNLSFFLSWPLSAFTAYLLAFVLTRRHDAAFLAGLSYGFTPVPDRRARAPPDARRRTGFRSCLVALHRFLETRRGGWLVLFAAAWVLQALANGYFIFFGAVLVGLWVLYFCSTQETWRDRAGDCRDVRTGERAAACRSCWRYHMVHQQYGLRRIDVRGRCGSARRSAAWFEVSSFVWLWSKVLPDSKDDPVPRRHGPDPGARRAVAQPLVEARAGARIPIVQWVMTGLALVTAVSVASILTTTRYRAVAAGLAGDDAYARADSTERCGWRSSPACRCFSCGRGPRDR